MSKKQKPPKTGSDRFKNAQIPTTGNAMTNALAARYDPRIQAIVAEVRIELTERAAVTVKLIDTLAHDTRQEQAQTVAAYGGNPPQELLVEFAFDRAIYRHLKEALIKL